ncbi:glycosyltransferase family 4 protein [Nitrincola tapanii]|uniref:Glycosyltransferase n=1 Tax=Nitrincola tapanii TaxID=1708751 RepID=A0A5A9W1K8_9GAMM|nr:glycosyltransferase family 4 protein [Nitrincola tapanii]KAA0874364.1 glycosyltransferase [Nitrincola tapanii]
MKVVQILPDLNGGGVERGTLEIAKGLVAAGHESIVISAGGRLVEQLEREGSRHVTWDLGKKSPMTFRHIWALRRWLKKEKPDILHLRSRMPAWIAWYAWKGLPAEDRPRFITTVHGLYSVSKYSSIMCRGERVIAVSNTVYHYIRDHYPDTDMNKVTVIQRGIDPEEFPYGYQPSQAWLEAWYQSYPQLKDKKVLTLPGRLTRLKGHHDFLDLIQALKNDGLAVQGLIVGGEDPKRRAYAQALYQRVKEMGLDSEITFTGNRSDMKEIYAVSDVVLSLSTKPESFGRTVLEALSIGTPVVGYDHGGVGELLTQFYPEGLVSIDESPKCKAFSAIGAEVKEDLLLYSLQDMCNKTLSLYAEMSVAKNV